MVTLFENEGNIVPNFFKPTIKNAKKALAVAKKVDDIEELHDIFNDIENLFDSGDE